MALNTNCRQGGHIALFLDKTIIVNLSGKEQQVNGMLIDINNTAVLFRKDTVIIQEDLVPIAEYDLDIAQGKNFKI